MIDLESIADAVRNELSFVVMRKCTIEKGGIHFPGLHFTHKDRPTDKMLAEYESRGEATGEIHMVTITIAENLVVLCLYAIGVKDNTLSRPLDGVTVDMMTWSLREAFDEQRN